MKLPILATLLLSIVTFNIQAANRYVSDQLITYMHSGPSAEFRIIGSVNAGSVINLIDTNGDTGYSKVINTNGRSGWISSKFVTRKVPAIVNLPLVQASLKDTKAQLALQKTSYKSLLDSQQSSLTQQQSSHQQLQLQHQQLSEKLEIVQQQNAHLQRRIDNQSEEVEMQWLLRGAGIIILGMILGLMVPHLPKKKKTNDQWA